MHEVRIISRRFDLPGSHTLAVAQKHGANQAVGKTFSMKPEEVLEEMERSGLRGKGGGDGPAMAKWRLIQGDFGGQPKYLAVNCDKSEPGTFKNRQIITRTPISSSRGSSSPATTSEPKAYVYIRGEYHELQRILQGAVDEAHEAGILGEKVLGHDYRVNLTLHRGAEAYICGEKSVLLESM